VFLFLGRQPRELRERHVLGQEKRLLAVQNGRVACGGRFAIGRAPLPVFVALDLRVSVKFVGKQFYAAMPA